MKLYLFIRSGFLKKNNFLCGTTCLKDFYFKKSTHNTSSSNSGTSSCSSSESDSDTEPLKPKISEQKRNNQAALNKLNALLQKIVDEEVVKSDSKINLAKPSQKFLRKETTSDLNKVDNVEKQMVDAVKHVAAEIGGDLKQTESELLLKLLSPVNTSTEVPATSLSDIVKGMKIDRESKPVEQHRSDQVRSLLQKVGSRPKPVEKIQSERRPKRPLQQKRRPEVVVQKINLFGGEPLGIFTNSDLKETSENKTWQTLYERDLKLAVTHPPANYFQQMILWTEQGKLWKFPIDNEQGLEEEKKVYFTEHVFLDEHLEPWCPPKGPIRHFMELVCVGLSKNPYLTAEAKKEHIDWYRNYFEDKKKILQEVGALATESSENLGNLSQK